VSRICSTAAPCPVLVVPGPADPKRSYSSSRLHRRARNSSE
jgi:hypothetical protein